MRFRDFLVAIFLGRFIRFGILSVLVLWFGPQIVSLFGGVVKRHWIATVATITFAVCLWLGLRLWRRVRAPEQRMKQE